MKVRELDVTEILGRGKLADIVITSGPLFASDSRILRVVAGGKTEFEAQ